MPTISHDYAEVNGLRLHYAHAGQGSLILFLHGFPTLWYDWNRQLQEFGNDHLAVAPDMPGYNLSSRPLEVGRYRLPSLVDDVRALCDHLKRETIVLVGHDFGGLIAWLFAAHYPERVEKLVILNAPHPAVFERELRDNPAQQLACGYMKLFNSGEAERELSKDNFAWLFRVVLEQGLSQGYRTEEDCRHYLTAWSEPGALTAGLNYYRANRLCPPAASGDAWWSARQAMPDLTSLVVHAPTLLLWGLKDKGLLAGNLSGLKPFVPNLQIELFTDAGHWIAQAKSKAVNARIREFLAETDVRPLAWSGAALDWGWGGLARDPVERLGSSGG